MRGAGGAAAAGVGMKVGVVDGAAGAIVAIGEGEVTVGVELGVVGAGGALVGIGGKVVDDAGVAVVACVPEDAEAPGL